MVRAMRKILLLAFALSLTGCGDDNRTAGGVSKSEADALDDAAEMVEQQRLPADAASGGAEAAPPPQESGKPGG